MTLDEEELRVLRLAMERMGLLASGETPRLTQLSGGVSSLIVRADTQHGSFCVKQALPKLKVAADWLAPVERSATEIEWLKVASRLAPGAVPQVRAEDRASFTFAMDYLDPQSYPVWKEQLRAGKVDEKFAGEVALLLVAIHRGTAGDQAIAAAFATDSAFYRLRLDPYLGATALAHPDLLVPLRRLIEATAAEKRALVHGDVSPKNILAGPEGPVLLDAECACYADPAFDLAFCLNHLLLKSLYRARWAHALLRCFDTLAKTYLAGVDWEPAQALEKRAAALLPGLLLARIDGKSPVEYLTGDSERDLVRHFTRPRIANPPATLAAIRTAWAGEIYK
jgi:aminoglycoside phosphotransferase (APT) family kinase protein